MDHTDQFSPACRLALLGQAVGDAFGAPFEYHPNAPALAGISMADQRYLDGRNDCGIQKIQHCRLPGLYTDDTQQALVLLHAKAIGTSIADAPGYVREVFRLMARIEPEVATQHPVKTSFGLHRGTGANFRTAVEMGEGPNTAGLGAAMRVGPVATMFTNPQEMVDWVYAVSKVTTTNPVALACAVRYAAVVWATASHQAEALRSVVWPAEVHPNVWQATSKAFRFLDKFGDEEALLKWAASTGWVNKDMRCAANGFALTGAAWSVHHAFKSNCFQNAMLNVCSSGGDTDTVAAMTGCLAALKFGLNDIPYWMIGELVGVKTILHPERWVPTTEKGLTEADARYRLRFFPSEDPPRDFIDELQAMSATVVESLDPVLFYGQNNPNGEYSNFYPARFSLDGEEWPDVEHYFMAQKSPEAGYQLQIRAARTPHQAKQIGRTAKLRPNWDNIKYGIMLRAVRAKFSQNPTLRELLLATGERPLHENCKDPWWGGGPNFKNGRDWLGRILMQVRAELKEG